MNVEEFAQGLKGKGATDEEIVETLRKIAADIDAYLSKGEGGEEKPNEEAEEATKPETDEEKRMRVFGI